MILLLLVWQIIRAWLVFGIKIVSSDRENQQKLKTLTLDQAISGARRLIVVFCDVSIYQAFARRENLGLGMVARAVWPA